MKILRDVIHPPPKLSKTRLCIAIAGTLVWLILTLSHTGWGSFEALWRTVLILVLLLAVTAFTRTVSFRLLAAMFLLGGLMMLAMLPVSAGLNFIGIKPNTFLRPFIVPPVEEVFKLVPVLLVLLIHRKAGALLLGISDVMLFSGFCGAGFNLVEEAYRLTQAPAQYLWWLPSAQVVGEVYATPRVIAGHAIWAMLAGIAIGFASLFRRGGVAMYAVALFGVVLATFDHLANNYWSVFGGGRHPDLLSQFLQFVDLRGWLVVWLFVLAAVGSILIDAFITRAALASSLTAFGEILHSKSKKALDKLIWQRRQAYLDFRCRKAPAV